MRKLWVSYTQSMNDYFNLIAEEFATRSRQVKQFIKSHGPSIGAAHEILLRSFLKTYLPKWVSVGHGFIMDKGDAFSKECDIIIYNSLFYSPLYQIEDFLVLAPESVIAVIEVKSSNVREGALCEAIVNLAAVKTINPDIYTALFIYEPPKLGTIKKYIEAFPGFSGMEDEHIPDVIYGMSEYVLEKTHLRREGEEPHGVGYVNRGGSHARAHKGFVIECLFYSLYLAVEDAINNGLKNGINYDWIPKIDKITNPPVRAIGRFRYATPEVRGVGVWEGVQLITAKKYKE